MSETSMEIGENCECNGRHLIALMEQYKINSMPVSARDIEWLFYDEHLKPFFQWILQIFSHENILDPIEYDRLQKISKESPLDHNTIKGKFYEIEAKYPELFSCNESQVKFYEKKLKLLKISEKNFLKLIDFQKELNRTILEEVTELRHLKVSSVIHLQQCQNECLNFAENFDRIQQHTTSKILESDHQKLLKNDLFTNDNELNQVIKTIDKVHSQILAIVDLTNKNLLKQKILKENLSKDQSEIASLYDKKLCLEAQKLHGFVFDNVDLIKIKQIATIASYLDLEEIIAFSDNNLISVYRNNVKSLSMLLNFLEDVTSLLLFRKLYYILEKTLSRKMIEALHRYLKFAYHETVMKTKLDLLKSGEMTVLNRAPNFRNDISPFMNFFMALNGDGNKISIESIIQQYYLLKNSSMEINNMYPANKMISFLTEMYPVNIKMKKMMDCLYNGPTSLPVLVPPCTFLKLNIYWERICSNEQVFKVLSKTFTQVLKEVQSPNLKHYKYFLWIYFHSDRRKLAAVMQEIITKCQHLKSRRSLQY